MNKAELESKHLAELHTLAEEAGIPRYRMLSREELVRKLLDNGPRETKRERPPRRQRGRDSAPPRQRETRASQQPAEQRPAAQGPPPERPKRKRRRRFRRRRRRALRMHDLLLPAGQGRQAIVYGETREGCTALLRSLAAELSNAKGPDPIALLIDPSPEELADWKREASRAEIVAAGQDRHTEDAIAQAVRRAEGGEDVILLIDSLSRFQEAFSDADQAKELFDAGIAQNPPGNGSLTVVAALEQQQSR